METSRLAAEKIKPYLPNIRRRVWDALEISMSSEQISQQTGIFFHTVRARATDLKDDGLIRESGKVHKNIRGCDENIWERIPGQEYHEKITGGKTQDKILKAWQIEKIQTAINALRCSSDYYALQAEKILLEGMPFLKTI